MLAGSLRILRVSAFATVVSVGFAALGERAVRADVGEAGLAFGRQVSRLPDLDDVTGGGYALHVNGAVIHRATARVDQPPSTVLDRVEAHCRASPGSVTRALEAIPETMTRALPPAAGAARSGIVRAEDEGGGMVACFVDDASPGSPAATLRGRLARLSERGDLSALGHLRYAFAERSARGGTRVTTLWTDGPLEVTRAFPTSGDAPGSDSPRVPRPASSRRTLTATVAGYPAAIRAYESASPATDVEDELTRAIVARGFVAAHASPGARAFLHPDGTEVIVAVGRRGSGSVVTTIETGKVKS